MMVAGWPRPNWEMTGRQGSFRARAMPDPVLSQGRAEREGGEGGGRGGEGCPRGEGVGSAATLQCGQRLRPRASPSGPFARIMFPGIMCRAAGQYRTGAL
jgi:hypothetical protein